MSFPPPNTEMSVLLVASDLKKSRHFYQDILGAELVSEYGGTTLVMKFAGVWLIITTSGDPTPDKPDISFTPPSNPKQVSTELTIKVPDCQSAYETLKERGAEFITPPYDWKFEIRCFFHDPDGHLLEISETVNQDN